MINIGLLSFELLNKQYEYDIMLFYSSSALNA